jgi:glutamate synthase domain-containing protein 2/glutamate synthase domain-containing protein 3
MVEALKYRSSIPYIGDILSIMVPPAQTPGELHQLWSRAMEPWDGPAFLVFCDGTTVGARLDRNGFRPCRWSLTDDRFYLASEAGNFPVDESAVIQKGTLQAGTGVTVEIATGEVDLTDSARAVARSDVHVDARLTELETGEPQRYGELLKRQRVFRYIREDVNMVLDPMIVEGKEPIGSMGNTARPAVLSEFDQPLFHYFYQHFAQVTNPPVDYIRERVVTELTTYLGRRPNIFAPKELIPPFQGIALRSHVVSLGELAGLKKLEAVQPFRSRISASRVDVTFPRADGEQAFHDAISRLEAEVREKAARGYTVLILSDEEASAERSALPSLLALVAASGALDSSGLRLMTSLVVCTGEVRSAHHVATLVGFGADAVCPYLALAYAREEESKEADGLSPDEREQNLVRAFETGLRRVMAKMGISVARSYQGSRLFSCIGLGKEVTDQFFPTLESPTGGISLSEIARTVIDNGELESDSNRLPHTYLYKEHPRGKEGEKHSMTVAQSKLLHTLVRSEDEEEKAGLYQEYLALTEGTYPTSVRHLLRTKTVSNSLPLDDVQPVEEILKLFGSGAMSFGAISDESQRDIIVAMNRIGGRSNSGEGGENPFYWSEGIHASTKQVASGRFGVTGRYLISGDEVQIKMAQGAKPGEGGQLMRAKVDEHIAKARHASPGIDLISPPPMHDIYSIEDLKGLIHELKQFHPDAKVNVKLVAGANVGTIAVGVAKAGADSIHISGGDGGTGAAALSSMKHAGLPWELGLVEANQALIENGLREAVQLRVDGGISTGLDVVLGAVLGANEFDFGKLLLVAEGCIMARVCEKNTCPTGIATHAERFKKKYKGTAEHVVELLTWVAKDVRSHLSKMGVATLSDLYGRVDLLEYHQGLEEFRKSRGVDCEGLLVSFSRGDSGSESPFAESVSPLNASVREIARPALEDGKPVDAEFAIGVTDRAVPATLSGAIARLKHQVHMQQFGGEDAGGASERGTISLTFRGSAGQGFGVLLQEGVSVRLEGEANDSVCKTMSGGEMVIVPPEECSYAPQDSMIIGNCALYGATGGRLYVKGRAGDRFAVRNSGSVAVVEGAGLHACEYMTSGTVIILGQTGYNLGAGMTGGVLYLVDANEENIHHEYLVQDSISDADEAEVLPILKDYFAKTGSINTVGALTVDKINRARLSKWVPR